MVRTMASEAETIQLRLQQLRALHLTVQAVCNRDPGDMISALVGVIVLVAAETKAADELMKIAIDAINTARAVNDRAEWLGSEVPPRASS